MRKAKRGKAKGKGEKKRGGGCHTTVTLVMTITWSPGKMRETHGIHGNLIKQDEY